MGKKKGKLLSWPALAKERVTTPVPASPPKGVDAPKPAGGRSDGYIEPQGSFARVKERPKLRSFGDLPPSCQWAKREEAQKG